MFCLLSAAEPDTAKTSKTAEAKAGASAKPASDNDLSPEATPTPTAASPTPARANSNERTALNLLGEVDSRSGESRRNENVRLTLIDNNVLREMNERMGTTATIIKEFDVEKNYFGKQYGGSPEAALHLPSSGVRGVHGRFFWSHQNSFFSARSFFQVGDVQPARTNDYGFSVGAPLGENTNITVDASQRKLRGQVNGNVLVPAADERGPTATDPAVRAVVEAIVGAYPAEVPNRLDINPRALNTNAPQNIDNDRLGVRLDHAWAEDRLSLGYNVTLQQVEAFQLVGGQNPDTTTKNHGARITWNRAWTASTVTDFSAGYDRIGSLLVPEETSIGPFFLFGRTLQSVGPSSNIPIDRAQNAFRYAGRIRHSRGNHLLTAGFELLRRQVNGTDSNNHRGTFRFSEDFGRTLIQNLLAGAPSSYRVALGSAHRGFRNWEMQFFLGDDWKVNGNLTLSLGLRYEPVTAPFEVNSLSDIPYDCDCNNFAPRFGFAYRLGGVWGVLRANYGIHYSEIYPATYMQTRFNPPGIVNLYIPNPNLAHPLGGRVEDDRSSLYLLDPELASPYSHQYNFSWQLEPVSGWTLDLGYVGSRSAKLFQAWYTNRAQPVPGIELTTGTVNERRPDPEFFEIQRVLNGSRGYFDAAKVALRIPRWAGLSVDAAYWFSKAIDLGNGYSNTAWSRDARNGRSQSEFNVHGEMRGVSDYDQPHAMRWTVNYQTPGFGAPSGMLSKILGQWQLSSIVLLKSGTPFSLRAGSDSPGVGNVDGTSGDRPNIDDPSILGRAIDHPDTSAQRMPREAFSFIQPGELAGNMGRNTLRKDGIFNINAGLSRRFTLGGDRALLFRAESLNFFNHPQFAEPGASLNEGDFGQITNTLNDGRAFKFTLQFSF